MNMKEVSETLPAQLIAIYHPQMGTKSIVGQLQFSFIWDTSFIPAELRISVFCQLLPTKPLRRTRHKRENPVGTFNNIHTCTG